MENILKFLTDVGKAFDALPHAFCFAKLNKLKAYSVVDCAWAYEKQSHKVQLK